MSFNNNKWTVTFNKDPYEYKPLPSLVFIVTVYNSENYIEECLISIANQKGENWRCIVIDDASTDSTWSIISNFITNDPSKFSGHRNSYRKWKLANFISALSECENDDVIVEVDGDDYLLYDNIAMELAELHRKYDTVWTQHNIDFSACTDWHTWYSTPLPENWTRMEPWRPLLWTRYMHPGHLRSFKRRYFNLIRHEDFKWNGEYLKACADAAYYTAILELTPPELRYFYDRSCLCYRITENSDTLNEFYTGNLPDIERQSSTSNRIKSLPPYEPIKIVNIFIPIYKDIDEENVITAVEWLHKKLPLAKLYVGLPKLGAMEIPKSCGISSFFNTDKIMNNLFSKIKNSRDNEKELFLVMNIDYIFRHTSLNHLIVIAEPERVYDLEEFNFDILKWSSTNGVIYLQKSPEILSSTFKYLRDESFSIKKNPFLNKLIVNEE